MSSPFKNPNWLPATHADPKPDPDPRAKPLDFSLTPSERTTVAMVRCDIVALHRHRDPEGLHVGTATEAEFNEAREAFRSRL